MSRGGRLLSQGTDMGYRRRGTAMRCTCAKTWSHWCTGPGRPAGWYLTRRRGGWQRLAIDADWAAAAAPAARPSGSQQAADLAPTLSTALALDAAANVLRGPAATPPRPLPRGSYELHTAGLAFRPRPDRLPRGDHHARRRYHGAH